LHKNEQAHDKPEECLVQKSESELQELLPHLCYEVRMLLMTDLLLLRERNNPRDPSKLDEWTVHNALFEAHTVHARGLFAFFFNRRTRPDDAIANDYVADWEATRPPIAPVLATVSPRVGKEIAHLTYGRLAYKTDEERQWHFTSITKELVIVINAWVSQAPRYVREELVTYLKDYAAQPEVCLGDTTAESPQSQE
jgi:hypothetical protein